MNDFVPVMMRCKTAHGKFFAVYITLSESFRDCESSAMDGMGIWYFTSTIMLAQRLLGISQAQAW